MHVHHHCNILRRNALKHMSDFIFTASVLYYLNFSSFSTMAKRKFSLCVYFLRVSNHEQTVKGIAVITRIMKFSFKRQKIMTYDYILQLNIKNIQANLSAWFILRLFNLSMRFNQVSEINDLTLVLCIT